MNTPSTALEKDQLAAWQLTRGGSRAIDAACLAVVVVLVGIGLRQPRFHSDSWSLLELSSTVFSDFYHAPTFRQFESSNPYSTAFPPLYPLVLALARGVFDVGVYTGVWVNALVCVGLLAALRRLARTLELPDWVGSLLFTIVLATRGFFDDFVAARTMPLAVLLFVFVIDAFVRAARPQGSPAQAVLCGAFAGASVLTRFDFLLPAVAAGGLLVLLRRDRFFTIAICYAAGAAPLLAPWVTYSILRHGRLWASDNVRTVLSIHPTHVLMYEPDPDRLPLLRSSPSAWIRAIFAEKAPPVLDMLLRSVPANAPFMALLVGVGVAARKSLRASFVSIPRPLAALASLAVLQVATLMLTGYAAPRYFTLPTLYVAVVLSVVGWPFLQRRTPPSRRRVWVVPSAVALVLLVAVQVLVFEHINLRQGGTLARRPVFTDARQYEPLTRELGGTHTRLLVMHDAALLGRFADPPLPPFLDPYRFGALTGITTIPQPLNLNRDNVQSFVHEFAVTHVYDPSGAALGWLGSERMSQTAASGLYRLMPPSQP